MSVSICVQHHPARSHLLPQLLEQLGGDAEVVIDPEPDHPLRRPLRTYLAALAATPAGVTHRLVLQDDAQPCQQFAGRMLAAVEERPDAMIAFFVPGAAPHRAAMIRAQQRGERWARLRSLWYPVVALCWPAATAATYVDWLRAKDEAGFARYKGDDGPVGEFCKEHRLDVWATVPSLVQHPDVEPSLIGRKAQAGKNRARVAALFTD